MLSVTKLIAEEDVSKHQIRQENKMKTITMDEIANGYKKSYNNTIPLFGSLFDFFRCEGYFQIVDKLST